MRRGTILFLLALILLVAFFGLLKAIGIIIASIAVLILLLFAALFVGAWLLKRRMRRKLAELQATIAGAAREAQERRRQDASRRDAIDVDGVVRDGQRDGRRDGK